MFTFADGSTTDEPTTTVGGALAAFFDELRRLRDPILQAPDSPGRRKLPLLATLLAARPAIRRRIIGDRLTTRALWILRGELARWFTPEWAFDAEGTIGDLELRRYQARIEACTQVDDPTLKTALDHGYGRLACYICGANQTGEVIERTMPVLIAMRDGLFTVSFVMPPGRTLEELPRSDHPGVELRKVWARKIAVLRFRGPVTDENLAAHECVLLQQVINAGLPSRGSVAFATFDSLATLPILRRNELWIEIV